MRTIGAMVMVAVMLAVPAARAQDVAPVPSRYRSVSVNPGEACPKPVGDEVVVCRTEDEPYRLPKALRHSAVAPTSRSWVDRAALIDEVGRVAGGLPDTCSPVGTGGQTGCAMATMREWSADRRAMARDAADLP